jgi:hypothetical protein
LGYGVESSRLNPFMSADPPLYVLNEVFDYSANFDADNDAWAKRLNGMKQTSALKSG